MVIYMQYKSKKKGRDQNSIQSSIIPNTGYQWESDFTIRHQREPSFIKFISLLGMAEDGKTDGMTVGMADGQRQTYIWGVSIVLITIISGFYFTYFFFVLIFLHLV